MGKFKQIFDKVNGKEVLKQYKRAGVLGFALVETGLLGFSHKSLEIVRLAVNNKILSKLRKEYKNFILKYKVSNAKKNEKLPQNLSNKVWVCWLQGIENAPVLVQRCFESLNKYLTDREIIVITDKNYSDYVEFPEHIKKKFESGVVTRTHFSDLLRLELLVKYGGTWIDATVLCTGSNIPEYILNSELFVYQVLKPGRDGHSTVISSWLMTSCTNNPILLLTRELLYEYWKEHNFMVDYFLLHDFFQLAIEAYPKEWKNVVQFSNEIPHILLLGLFDKFNVKHYGYIKNMTCFHKLSYKFEQEKIYQEGTYYDEIINLKKF
jgi:hypothetical protein